MKLKSFIMLSFFCTLIYADVCHLAYVNQRLSDIFSGPTVCENGTVDSVTVNGPLTINGTTIKTLKVNGPVTADLANISSLHINGILNITHSKVSIVEINGQLSSENNEFGSLNIHGISKLTNSIVLNDISISKDAGSSNRLEIYLYQNTNIHGDIVFKNGNGTVYKSSTAIITGKVLNGKIVNI